jgi:hypothetical protein
LALAGEGEEGRSVVSVMNILDLDRNKGFYPVSFVFRNVLRFSEGFRFSNKRFPTLVRRGAIRIDFLNLIRIKLIDHFVIIDSEVTGVRGVVLWNLDFPTNCLGWSLHPDTDA